ncbi:MAG: ABC transporter ATP-binding protein [Spirochaetales bacterium]
MNLELHHVSKDFGTTRVVNDVSFTVESGELISLVGPSGVGKTTLLRMIAGIDVPTEGQIRFERPVNEREPVILVFQDYMLFPHMTIRDNVAFGLEQRGWLSRAERAERVAESLRYFELEECAQRYPSQVSGGQKQRAALARALVLKPAVLLLDEPFAHLDRNLKLQTAEYIRSTQRSFGTTTIAVTHDLEEAFAMSDRLGVMLDGGVARFDTVQQVYNRPGTLEAARFLGPVNRVATVDAEGLCLPREPETEYLLFRAEHARLEAADKSSECGHPAVISDVRFLGIVVRYTVEFGNYEIVAFDLSRRFTVGEQVIIHLTDFFEPLDAAQY